MCAGETERSHCPIGGLRSVERQGRGGACGAGKGEEESGGQGAELIAGNLAHIAECPFVAPRHAQ